MRITLNPAAGFTRARFEIRYDQAAVSVNIGDSISNDGDGGDARTKATTLNSKFWTTRFPSSPATIWWNPAKIDFLAEWRGASPSTPAPTSSKSPTVRFGSRGSATWNRPISLPWMGNRTEKVWSTSTSTPSQSQHHRRPAWRRRQVTVTLFGPEQ
ncbi:MAG: hypothetical protein R2838_05435 [Caldilineaceae bacterium]